MSFPSNPKVLNDFVTVQEASRISGYSQQYIRRLLRKEILGGIKIGNIWLLNLTQFQVFLQAAEQALDQRYGAKLSTP